MLLVHAGNRIDAADRPTPRFPAAREAAVAQRLGALLDLLRPAGVVTAAAAGADLLLVEAAQSRSLPVHLVLPLGRERFRATSVADQGALWGERFDRAVEAVSGDPRSSAVELSLPSDDGGYRTANQALVDRALALDPEVLAVAVRPRRVPADGSVTDDFVERAEAAGLFVVEVDPLGP